MQSDLSSVRTLVIEFRTNKKKDLNLAEVLCTDWGNRPSYGRLKKPT